MKSSTISTGMRKRTIRVVVISVIVSILLLLFFIICLHLSVYVLLLGKKDEEMRYIFNDYIHKTVNPTLNTTYTSFSTLPKRLDQFEYLTYVSDGNHHLIYNYDDSGNEYQCQGGCFCGERRRSLTASNILVRGLMYFLVAANTAISFSIAKDYFNEYCQSTYSGECQEDSDILSVVEDCEPIGQKTEEKLADEVEGDPSSPPKKKPKKTRNFWCKGRCRSILGSEYKDLQGVPLSRIENMLRTYDCSKMVMENPMRKFDCGGKELENCVKLAEAKFRTMHLIKFCRSGSLRSFQVNFRDHSEMVKMGICVEGDLSQGFEYQGNEVKCVEE